MTIEGIAPRADTPIAPMFPRSPIAGFWRRFAAWLVDILLLGIFGQVLGWTLSSIWFQIGPYGRFVGLLFILPYFGLMNSSYGNGQTVGKRLLKIAVRDRDNKPITVGRSLLRISILATPAILNGWALPIFRAAVLDWLLAVIVFGVGVAIPYTMVFNRRARQGLHDMICGTYVVHLAGKPIETFPQSARIHWVISSMLIALAAVIATVTSVMEPYLASRTALAPIHGLYQTLEADSRFLTVSVNDNTHYSSRGPTIHSLQVRVWYKGVPSKEERIVVINGIAKVVLDRADNIDKYDLLDISVTSGYDLGIASGHITFGDAEPIEVWRKRVSGSHSQ